MLPEELSISNLKLSSFNFSNENLKALRDFFIFLRNIDDKISRTSPNELHETLWAFLGILGRCYQLMLCCIDELTGGNWNGFYAAARGLIETLCSIIWVNENHDRLPSLVQTNTLRIGGLLNSGYKKYPYLKTTYSYISGITHPNRDSHLLGFRTPEEGLGKEIWSPFNLSFSNYFANEKMGILIQLSKLIVDEINLLIADGPMLFKSGRLMGFVSTKKKEIK